MSRTRRKHVPGLRPLVITLSLAAALVALVAGLHGHYARLLAEHWRGQLDTVPDDRAFMLLTGVARLGQAGIPVLVEALGSERESVARAGKQVLLDEIGRWESLRARDASPKLVTLAESLADTVGQFGPTARIDAAELATRILRWPLDDRVVEQGRVIASCERVLRATTPERHLLADSRFLDRVEHVAPGGGRRELELAVPEPKPELVRRGPPSAFLRIAKLPTQHTPKPAVAATPSIEPPPRIASGPGSLEQPRRLLMDPEDAKVLPIQRSSPNGAVTGNSASNEWEKVETADVMRRLHSRDKREATRAEQELVQRGFSEVHLELARRLFNPDPKVRRELVRMLPGLRTINAVQWLLQLSRDPDSEVRLAAIALMATTDEPALLKEIEQIARHDPDVRVRRQAEQIFRRGREKRY